MTADRRLWLQSSLQMPKPPVKSVMVRFRAFPKELAAWRRLSRADAMTLSTWIRDSLNARLDEPESPFADGSKRVSGRRTAP